MKTQITTLFFLLTGGILLAQAPDKTKLGNYFQVLDSNNKFMGNVSLSKDGKTVYAKSIGFTDFENNKKSNTDTKFRIGSITKTFTTVLIFKAVEEKKISLTDKLEKWFPAVANSSKITIGNMLSHRSGIHDFTNDDVYLTYMSQPKTEAEMVAIIAKAASDFEPDSKTDYSNSNFVLLTYIVEKTFKKPYAELVKEKITTPLGLKNTYYGGKVNVANNEANSYTFKRKWEKEPETDMSIPAGAGAIVSNVADLSRFIEALFSGKLVSAASLEQMKTIRDGLGMGLFEMKLGGKTGYGHNGGIDGFTSILVYFPDDKTTFALTSNGKVFSNNKIATTVINWFNNKPVELPEFKVYNYKVTTEELDALVGIYASTDIPIKITITKDDTILFAQGTGQSAFPLDAAEKNIFRFDTGGIVLEFDPAEKKMILKQGGAVFNFKKE